VKSGNWNSRGHVKREQLHGSLRFSHGIARADLLGRRMRLLGVPSKVEYKVYVSRGDVRVGRARRTSRIMLDGIIHHRNHRRVRKFVAADVEGQGLVHCRIQESQGR